MSNKKKNYSTLKEFVLGLMIFLLVLSLWYYSWTYIDHNIFSSDLNLTDTESRGLFGDKFGAVNALFSALAFAGIIFTIFLQRKELKLQRQELVETRSEFKINRLTNILFRQIELINNRISESRFYKSNVNEIITDQYSIEKIISVFEVIERLGEKNKKDLNHKININSPKIIGLLTSVHFSFQSFEKLLNQSGLEKQEFEQLKSLLKENINPSLFSLLNYRFQYAENISSDDADIQEIAEGVKQIELSKMKYLLEF
ncbi:hypothetical protein [Aequorivita soesokkakensis]|nr:hypothetical protein [Aequorivita soesokkakensis]